MKYKTGIFILLLSAAAAVFWGCDIFRPEERNPTTLAILFEKGQKPAKASVITSAWIMVVDYNNFMGQQYDEYQPDNYDHEELVTPDMQLRDLLYDQERLAAKRLHNADRWREELKGMGVVPFVDESFNISGDTLRANVPAVDEYNWIIIGLNSGETTTHLLEMIQFARPDTVTGVPVYQGQFQDIPRPAEVTLTSIAVTPAADTLNNSDSRQFVCTATYSDRSTAVVTGSATWSVSPGTAGSISTGGLFTAATSGTGSETVTAQYEGQNATATVVVEADAQAVTLTALTISPSLDTLQTSESRQFTCTATYSDQSTMDATAVVTWSTSPGTAGSITQAGLFTASASTSGSETVMAYYQGLEGFAYVTVQGIQYGTMTGNDGTVYETVIVGTQEWMAENLMETQYRDNSAIEIVSVMTAWPTFDIGAYCIYDNTNSNADTYGYLYNWFAVNDSRQIAPLGWHVPTDEDWKTLEIYLGMNQNDAGLTGPRGTSEGAKLAGNGALWTDGILENNGVFGLSGFSALPGGHCGGADGGFRGLSTGGYFWTATENAAVTGEAWRRAIYYDGSNIERLSMTQYSGYSIRLVKDN